MTTKNTAETLRNLAKDLQGRGTLSSDDLDLVVTALKDQAYHLEREATDEDRLKSAREQASAQMDSIARMVAAVQCDYDRMQELRDQKVPRYVAGWNLPGYMPDMDVAEFDDPDDAMDFIREEVCRVIDEDETLPDDVANQQKADVKSFWRPSPQGEFGQTFGNYHYFVTQDGTMGLDEDELKELEELEAAAGDCASEDEARQRIEEDALEVSLRSDWQGYGETLRPTEFTILLCTGGPAVRIVGELDEHLQPCRAWIEAQDWFTPWSSYDGDNFDMDTVLAYCQCFYFGE